MTRQLGSLVSFLLVFASALPARAQADTLPIISIDADQKEKVTMVSTEDYTKSLGSLVRTMNDTTISTLQNHEQSATRSGPRIVWMLRDVTVGLGTTLTVGISHIWSISFAPRVRFAFSNSTHPKIPD